MKSPNRLATLLAAAALLPSLPLFGMDKKKQAAEELLLDPPPKKSKKDNQNQALPPLKDPPAAVTGETSRLMFQVSPLSARGLLSQQTRDALHTLLRASHGATIVKLRAFVAGSGDTRRIQEIAGEVFGAAHLALPALTVVQAGSLPLEGAQVEIESIGVDKRDVNPNGVAFLSGQAADSPGESIGKLQAALRDGGMAPADALRVTCFIGTMPSPERIRSDLEKEFPNAAIDYLQLQRGPVTPASECEAVARLRTPPDTAVSFRNPANLNPTPSYTQLVLVNAPKLVFSSLQLGFGSQESDIRLAFERLRKALAGSNAGLENLVMSHVYVTSMSIAETVRGVRKTFYNPSNPPASTLLPFEALPSLDAAFGVDVVAVADSGAAAKR